MVYFLQSGYTFEQLCQMAFNGYTEDVINQAGDHVEKEEW
jgi:hypothetical protein